MNTPLNDFVSHYSSSDFTRLHMPGHKGIGENGEPYDITEICGADVLYHEKGILLESEKNAAELFGSRKTLYSVQGSTLCIQAMLLLVKKYAKSLGTEPLIAAGRNAHKAFLNACALLGLDPIWLKSSKHDTLCSFHITSEDLEQYFQSAAPLPTALYLTSPDYLGNVLDLESISKVCKKYKVLFLVDNAHGAYLHFLPQSQHPLTFGADLCCDSAHKTLPVLTGGAYLHIGKNAPEFLADHAESTISVFASTSPSYLILASLDRCNLILNKSFRRELICLCEKVEAFKKQLKRMGFCLTGSEPLKITVMPKFSGYTGSELSDLMRKAKIECEFSDPDYLVMMFSPQNSPKDFDAVEAFFRSLPQKEPIPLFPPRLETGEKRLSIRDALFSPSESKDVKICEGRILADPCITCPPAVPIAICGEEITPKTIQAFLYYGVETIRVILEK